MKMVMAIVRNDRLSGIQESLRDAGITAYTVSATIGVGEHGGEQPRQHLKIEMAIPDMWENAALRALRRGGSNGESSEGIIFVYTLDRALKIRTGDEGEGILAP